MKPALTLSNSSLYYYYSYASLIIYFIIIFSSFPALTSAWLPWKDKNITSNNNTNLFEQSHGKIRGVNLDSFLVLEPWIARKEWTSMNCGNQLSEFDCVSHLGQDAADSTFQRHWHSWITREDISEIASLGLNTVRIPVGYWLYEELVDLKTEHFPKSGWGYFERVCRWAGEEGIYVIVDLHGAPGAQVKENADTGQYAPEPGFYNDSQYGRALTFLEWITKQIHTNDNLTTVGMLEIVNEPVQNADQTSSMRTSYYPNAIEKIRSTEESTIGSLPNNSNSSSLHIQMMSKNWGSGDPNEALHNNNLTYHLAYDEHRYLKYDKSIPVDKNSYISASCKGIQEQEGLSSVTVVSEWSLSPPDNVEWDDEWNPNNEGNKGFYAKWFLAQITSYERDQIGWVFWGWKQELGDYRWGYRDAVNANVIPKDINAALKNEGVCK